MLKTKIIPKIWYDISNKIKLIKQKFNWHTKKKIVIVIYFFKESFLSEDLVESLLLIVIYFLKESFLSEAENILSGLGH